MQKGSAGNGGRQRLDELDALRGLAALSVFFHHALGMLPETPRIVSLTQHTPLHILYDGKSAVLLFFVLSGFVLNLRYASQSGFEKSWIPVFLVRRVMRIYPAFLVVLFLGAALFRFCPKSLDPSSFSGWFWSQYQAEIKMSDVFYLITLIGPGVVTDVNPVSWSLVEEMRISIVFPLVIIVLRRELSLRVGLSLLVAVYCICYVGSSFGTIRYFPHFILGAFLAKHFSYITIVVSRLKLWKRIALFALGILLYETPAMTKGLIPSGLVLRFPLEQLAGIGAAIIIFGCTHFQLLRSFLRTNVLQFTGRTSYGFYLIHMLLLLHLSPHIYGYTGSFILSWLGALVLGFGVAWLMFRFIELPFIALGQRGVHFLNVRMS